VQFHRRQFAELEPIASRHGTIFVEPPSKPELMSSTPQASLRSLQTSLRAAPVIAATFCPYPSINMNKNANR
jgi:hypothetical protein